MCNLYRLDKAPAAIGALVRAMGRELAFPEGAPNLEPRDVRITEQAAVLRPGAEPAALELVARRWSWPGPGGKPVFNFRAEGRRFARAERCIAVADAFYEFTAPDDPKARRKDRWRFDWPGQEWFGIAAVLRAEAAVGEAFALLTCPPGPDVSPYHDRQVVLLSPPQCLRWLDGEDLGDALTAPLPGGTLAVRRD